MSVVSTGSTTGAVAKVDDLVTFTIDGQQVSVPKGTLVIRAAEAIGVQIPRFCDHPLLAPVGACRQCLVEVALPGPDGEPKTMMGPPGRVKPQASCTLVASPGMVVNTQLSSPIADKAQQGVMEALLINHPLDCPVCDKGGECPLQNQAMSNGQGETRFMETKRTFPKPINISAQVLLDRERCVLCARCTRFSEQVAGDPFIALIERGALQQVGTYEKEPFESYFSGNTIQICPVGALTSAAYRFRSRPFDLVSVPSIAEHDACGSAIRLDHRRGKVVRRLAGNDPAVNEEWITDKDRFAFTYAQQPDRVTHPLVREDGELRPASWPEALAVAARGLERALRQGSGTTGGVGVLTGGRLTLEDAYAYSKFARLALRTNDIDFRSRPHSAEEADFLASTVAAAPVDVTFESLEKTRTILLLGLEPEEEAGALFLRLRKAARAGARIFSVAPLATRGLEKLDGILIPVVPGDEGAVIAELQNHAELALDARGVVLVGERLATSPGALSSVLGLISTTGAKLAWVPRRAGDRGAVDAGCLPNLLPGGRPVDDAHARVDVAADWGTTVPTEAGRDADAILAAAAAGELGGLVIGGVELDDFSDPAQAKAAVAAAGFVVSLEVRHGAVTEVADVIFPVAPHAERSGTYVNWEGRPRSFDKALTESHALPDLRVLAGVAEELGVDLGFRNAAQVAAEIAELGPWDGDRHVAPAKEAVSRLENARLNPGEAFLATWKLLIDDGRLLDGDEALKATGRRGVALVSQATYDEAGLGDRVVLSTERGTVELPVAVAALPDGVLWAPANNDGVNLARDLGACAGAVVRLSNGGAA
ncbi:MAG TPA: NADH-quinone oxidoreductase subunit G [Nocardioidaceae bacterium]|nr:NADH-quinone oxidoreductase subunit G [Nocardioidaceae bacterium]